MRKRVTDHLKLGNVGAELVDHVCLRCLETQPRQPVQDYEPIVEELRSSRPSSLRLYRNSNRGLEILADKLRNKIARCGQGQATLIEATGQ
jgi:hypothetical protein